jgi:hypothetical protein
MSDEKKDMSVSPTGALRDNKGKAPVHWVPFEVVEAIALVLFRNSVEGGGRYPRHNWRKGAQHSIPLDSLIRHAMKLAGGEKIDPEDGLPHSWKIACNAAFLVFYEKRYPNLDDLKDVTPQAEQPAPEATPQTVVAPKSSVNLGSLLGPLLMGLAQAQQTPSPEPMGGDSYERDAKPFPKAEWRPGNEDGSAD